jgi:hypothetical protein
MFVALEDLSKGHRHKCSEQLEHLSTPHSLNARSRCSTPSSQGHSQSLQAAPARRPSTFLPDVTSRLRTQAPHSEAAAGQRDYDSGRAPPPPPSPPPETLLSSEPRRPLPPADAGRRAFAQSGTLAEIAPAARAEPAQAGGPSTGNVADSTRPLPAAASRGRTRPDPVGGAASFLGGGEAGAGGRSFGAAWAPAGSTSTGGGRPSGGRPAPPPPLPPPQPPVAAAVCDFHPDFLRLGIVRKCVNLSTLGPGGSLRLPAIIRTAGGARPATAAAAAAAAAATAGRPRALRSGPAAG